MELSKMYPGVHGSVPTQLAYGISATATAIELASTSVLPAAPNILTVSADDQAELVYYGAIDGNTLRECVRGFAGTMAQIWPQGTICYRAYTAVDHKAFIDNIDGLSRETIRIGEEKQDASALSEGAFACFGTGASDMARGNHTHSGYLTAETDPTVPAWAKAASKPTYTAADVGAVALVSGKADPGQLCSGIARVEYSRTLMKSDAGRLLEVVSDAATILYIPQDMHLDLPVGSEIEVAQEGAGEVSIAAAEEVVLLSLEGMRKIAGRYGVVSLKKHGANSWRLAGALK